jgi:cytochrome c peroxidase
MHDGRFATLDEVVAFYATRVRLHPNLDSRLIEGNLDAMRAYLRHEGPLTSDGAGVLGLPMNSRDRGDLVAFLKTLTDREFITTEKYSDPFTTRSKARTQRVRGTKRVKKRNP